MDVMAPSWPQETTWPNNFNEHVTHLSHYLGNAFLSIEAAKEPSIPTPRVKTLIAAICTILLKIENIPDYHTIIQTLTTIQDDLNNDGRSEAYCRDSLNDSHNSTASSCRIVANYPNKPRHTNSNKGHKFNHERGGTS